MNYIIGYINCKKALKFKKLQKIIGYIFFKIKVIRIDENKYDIGINSNKINKRRIKKIEKTLKTYNINKLVISNVIDCENKIILNNIVKSSEKILMKGIIKNILKYIFKNQNTDLRFEDIFITIKDDKNKEIIKDIANEAKSINIVTDTIKKMRRLSINLEKEENIIFSISNNCKKGLKRAKTIINFDCTNEFFEKFKVNRNAIIINLNENELKLGNYYQGIIIENIEIDYKNNEKSNYNKTKLYESYICNLNYFSIQEKYNEDNCIISNLIGKNGFIQNRELKKVRTELDKLSKKD